MGRRRAAKKVIKKARPTVAKSFKCLFCNHAKAVTCKLDQRSMTGSLSCSICEAKYQTHINTLSEAIDVYTEWLDETADAQAMQAQQIRNQQSGGSSSSARGDRDDNEYPSSSRAGLDTFDTADVLDESSGGEEQEDDPDGGIDDDLEAAIAGATGSSKSAAQPNEYDD